MNINEVLLDKQGYESTVSFCEQISNCQLLEIIEISKVPTRINNFASDTAGIDAFPNIQIRKEDGVMDVPIFLIEKIGGGSPVILFKNTMVYWKYWAKLRITDVQLFLDSLWDFKTSKSFIIANLDDDCMYALLDDEYYFNYFECCS